uniref:Putative tick transposon n=1 Tax=Ixodes ricinus TaxID=34613 RepID=A0A147BSL7_IXORI
MTHTLLFLQMLLALVLPPTFVADWSDGSDIEWGICFPKHGPSPAPAPCTSPNLDTSPYFTWQPGTASAEQCLQKELSLTGQLGHVTAEQAITHTLLFLQVSYLDNVRCFRTSDPCLIMVSCPNDDVRHYLRLLSRFCIECCYFVSLSQMLLVIDIESNPGPNTEAIASILSTVQRIEATQGDMLAKVIALQNEQKSTSALVGQLSTRVTAIEAELAEAKAVSGAAPTAGMSVEIANIQKQCDDHQNRLRRCNLLFFGCPDTLNETWSQSEETVLAFCSEKLGIQLDPSNLERSHRLGKFQGDKNRPIIVKFSRFKDKESILASGFKLKGSDFAVREDFSASVRQSRAKLFEYGKSLNVSFKVRFDKLHIGNKRYFFDQVSQSVVELNT